MNEKIQVTCALSGFRHVAKMYFVGLLAASNCFTKPKPSPRLQPVIKMEFMITFFFFFKSSTLNTGCVYPIRKFWVKPLKKSLVFVRY